MSEYQDKEALKYKGSALGAFAKAAVVGVGGLALTAGTMVAAVSLKQPALLLVAGLFISCTVYDALRYLDEGEADLEHYQSLKARL